MGLTLLNYIDSVEITHSRLEFSGGGIDLNSYDSNSTRVITDNVISVGSSDYALRFRCCNNTRRSRLSLGM